MADQYKANLARAFCEVVDFGFGLTLYALFERQFAGPIGLVWGFTEGCADGKSRKFRVYHSYVLPFARRQGVRSRLNDEIFKTHDIIVTCSGSENSGLDFIKARGYTLDEATQEWYLRKSVEAVAEAVTGNSE